ncbi:hypothetical protein ABT168_29300 [Streptomyces sp. NPDC001793]|uniref:hypothetical protein n=1 Tax=Streptomyces sp. NPDC001793 TaxID=3154657 RepID=UPI00331DD0EF
MNELDEQPKLALPLQAPPVHRDGWTASAARDDGDGVEPSRSCADLTGLARQMCYAGGGIET